MDMRKIIKGLISLVFAGMLCVGAVGCSSQAISAYEIAKQNGFVGTEEAWLQSLHGANGEDGKDLTATQLYEAWKADGNEGTFTDFCKTLEISIPQQNDTATISENMLSVVSIYCNYTKTTTTSSGGIFSIPTEKVQYKSSAGSGVIVDLNKEAGNAYIVTNYHVVYDLDSDDKGIVSNIWIYPYGATNGFTTEKGDVGGEGIRATYVGGAMDYDIAVLKIEGSQYLRENEVREATWGNSENITVGEETYVVGNPGGLGIAVTNGIVSVPSEYIGIYALDNRDLDRDGKTDVVPYRVMRTSAAINSGNSGGGIFNTKGELIGIVNAKNTQSTTDNMGYALPISQVKAIYDNIWANGGKVMKATLGITVSVKKTQAYVDENGNARIKEIFEVQSVERNSAAHGKLNVGDRFLSVKRGEEEITFVQEYQLLDFLLTVRKGETVEFTVLNGEGEQKTTSITFEEKNFTIYE